MFSEPHKIEHDRVSSNQNAVSESKRIVGKKKLNRTPKGLDWTVTSKTMELLPMT